MARFDWYECTYFGIDPIELIRRLERHKPNAVIAPDKAQYGYRTGVAFSQGRDVIARVWWEGNEGVHVSTTSSHAHDMVPILREHGGHFVTRLDACEDWIERGLFDRIASQLITYALDHRITITQVGDWARGEARTLYLGSKSSPVRLVLYEKGYEQGAHPDWVRLEVRVRPKGARAREDVSRWTPDEAFGAARWVTEALHGLGWTHLQAKSIGTVRRRSSEERVRYAMVRQYHKVLMRWIDEEGLEAFHAQLCDMADSLTD